MKAKKVYITGIEGNGGISAWDWFYKEQDRERKFDEYVKMVKDDDEGTAYKGELEVKSTKRNDITDEVENFLHENEFENSPNFIKVCSSKP